MKPHNRKNLEKWLGALTNPRLLFCMAVGWFITNGWSYCALGAGVYFEIDWLSNLATVYLGLLWLPGTPEKIVTFGIAIALLRLWFPSDTRTLALLKAEKKKLSTSVKKRYRRIKERLFSKKNP